MKLKAGNHSRPLGLGKYLIQITPSLAKEMYRGRRHPDLSPETLTFFVRILESKTWDETQTKKAPIILGDIQHWSGPWGEVLNGHHRLKAIIETNSTINCWVEIVPRSKDSSLNSIGSHLSIVRFKES